MKRPGSGTGSKGHLRVATSVDLSDEDGVRAAYALHGGELYRFALRQLGDEGLASDAVQEVFLRAWRAADRFDAEVASLRVWLFAIARNVVVDEARRGTSRRFVPLPRERLIESAPPVASREDAVVTGWVVEEALRRLSAEHRGALVETHLRGRPHDQVAAELGIPIGTLRSRIFYALKALRLALDEMGVEL